nr:PREDICTED: uncharacterized protein LOC108213906 isoform X1 [Daucus carota subsp. sativus]XP_017241180.1 PREDICTED: uncharacterized protein LOC108213906 isoform X1 [Daucus carota subsp. sativus]
MSISGTKTAVNGEAAHRESITTAAAQRATSRIAVNDEAVQDHEIPPGFRKLINVRGWTVMDDAYCIFADDYKEKNREKFPPTRSGLGDKFPYVKSAKENKS